MTRLSTEKTLLRRQGSAVQLEASHFRGEVENSLVWTIYCARTIFPHDAVVTVDPKSNTEFKCEWVKTKAILTTEPASQAEIVLSFFAPLYT